MCCYSFLSPACGLTMGGAVAIATACVVVMGCVVHSVRSCTEHNKNSDERSLAQSAAGSNEALPTDDELNRAS